MQCLTLPTSRKYAIKLQSSTFIFHNLDMIDFFSNVKSHKQCFDANTNLKNCNINAHLNFKPFMLKLER